MRSGMMLDPPAMIDTLITSLSMASLVVIDVVLWCYGYHRNDY